MVFADPYGAEIKKFKYRLTKNYIDIKQIEKKIVIELTQK